MTAPRWRWPSVVMLTSLPNTIIPLLIIIIIIYIIIIIFIIVIISSIIYFIIIIFNIIIIIIIIIIMIIIIIIIIIIINIIVIIIITFILNLSLTGSVMIVVWIFLASIGLFFARYTRNVWTDVTLFEQKVWFQVRLKLYLVFISNFYLIFMF